jgi:Putative adhesin
MRRETFQTPGELTLDLSLREGRVELETVDGAETEVELEVAGDSDEARRLLEDTRIELRHETELVVAVPKAGILRLLHELDVRLSIRAPHGTHVRAESASADLHGRGRFGSLEAKSAAGDVELDAVIGDAVVKTASGDVEVGEVGGDAVVGTASGDVELGRVAGETVVKAASGDIRLREAGRSVSISTASGDQRLAAVAAGTVTLQSASGDIEVGIRQGSNVWVDARAMSGETRSELELGDAEPAGDDAPLVELRATTMSGDVSVVRAAASEARAI